MSGTSMDIDFDNDNPNKNANAAQHQSQEKTLKLHPLSIIGISDHYTRVSTGGSQLPSNSPTIGLLFGNQGSKNTISIIDAEEVETSLNPATLTEEQMNHIRVKIELHQKVFPMHEVVGWYKVTRNESNEDDADVLPTAEDLRIHNGWMRQFNENPLFALMDASEKKTHSKPTSNTDGEDAREKLDRDEELPLTLYETMTIDGGGMIFVNLEFDLETFEPERIAVEKVFKTQPKAVLRQANNSTTGPTSNPKAASEKTNSKTKSDGASASESASQPTAAELHIQSVITSIDAMNARVAILLDFLHKVRDGKIAPNHTLLRQVMSLVKQLPIVMGRNPFGASKHLCSNGGGDLRVEMRKELDDQYGDMLVMSYLAALAKTTKAVAGYSEKFHFNSQAI